MHNIHEMNAYGNDQIEQSLKHIFKDEAIEIVQIKSIENIVEDKKDLDDAELKLLKLQKELEDLL